MIDITISNKITLLNRTTLESFNAFDKSDIVQKFTDAAIIILGADFGFGWMKEKEGDDFKLAYKSGATPYEPKLPRKQGGNQLAQTNLEPVFINDVNGQNYEEDYDVSLFMKSYVIIPIYFNGYIYGNLIVCYKNSHNFSEEENGLCVALGNATAQAITINRLLASEKLQRTEAERQQARFQALIENSFDAIGLVTPQGKIVYASPPIIKFSGYSPEDLVGANMANFIYPDDIPLAQDGIKKILEAPGNSNTIEFRYRHKDGGWRWMQSTWLNMIENPAIGSIVVNVHDITESKRAEATIKSQALSDPLTELPNRKDFGERFERILEQAKRHNRQLALMFLDMDRFKNVNDRLGHSVGDTMLKVIASRFLSCLRPEDVVSRFGGDEFLILINEIDSDKDASVAAGKILKAINVPLKLAEHTLYPSVSIGIATFPGNGENLETLKRKADIALYRSKNNGRNRFSFYDENLDSRTQVESFSLENELREALAYNQINPFYQPIVNLKNGKLVAVEALARWNHPERGLLPPAEFIGLAEETGLISTLDTAILKQACAAAKMWQTLGLGKFRIAVNVSAQSFCEADFISGIAETLAEHELDPAILELEITESLAMNNLELTAFNLRALKKLGIRITIDDFGTGYSSLSYLKSFPITSLKIDKSFIRHCITDPQDTSITKTIIAMAQILNLKVVAEGVETLQHFDFLASLGCNFAQGFYISKPMEAKELLNWHGVKKPRPAEAKSLEVALMTIK
ncbi:MAG: EAL domain-containing protein [Candidatus Doudnabacteria bacterium]|nr:EAL domain-containing protein [Candidatus Doudnabacteria bacterium]